MRFVGILLIIFLTGCGAKGEKGDTGPAGADGTGLTIISNTSCFKSANSLVYMHKVTTYSSGDKFISCEIDGGLIQTYTGVFYKASQAGATAEGCLVTWDLDAASGGFWTFSNSAGVRKAVYDDSASASDGNTVTFASGDCSTN